MNDTETQIGQFLQRLRQPVHIALHPNVRIYVTPQFLGELATIVDATSREFILKVNIESSEDPPTIFGIPVFTILSSYLDDNELNKPYRIVVEL